MVYVSKGLSTCAKHKVNQIEHSLFDQLNTDMYKKTIHLLPWWQSFFHYVKDFTEAGTLIPLTTVPPGYQAFQNSEMIASTLKVDQKVTIFINFLESLKCMHDNDIIHRDLKPDNVIVSQRKTHVHTPTSGLDQKYDHDHDFNVFIVDIDASVRLKQLKTDNSTSISDEHLYSTITQQKLNEPIGTPLYMSPESVSSGMFNTTMSTASDIWSAGVLFYSWMAGDVSLPKNMNDPYTLVFKIGSTIDPQHELYGLSGIQLLQSLGGLSNTSVLIDIRENNKQWYNEAMKLLIQMTQSDAMKRPTVDQLIQLWPQTKSKYKARSILKLIQYH